MTFEKTLKELCLENARQFEQDRIQKEYVAGQKFLQDVYEEHKDKIEQIREIINQNSLEGKLQETISISMDCSGGGLTEYDKIRKWFQFIGVRLSYDSKCDVTEASDMNPIYAKIIRVNSFKYWFSND